MRLKLYNKKFKKAEVISPFLNIKHENYKKNLLDISIIKIDNDEIQF